MDFGALPPEINSARMYSGPGPATMLAAAAAWDQLGGELHSAASHYQSVVSELASTSWQGPSSVSMVAAAAPQIRWLTATGAQAEQTAGQARVAVSVYETALAMTVPPPVIAANRAQLMTLSATNFLGQNTPAIAATEVLYAEMWAQDAAAMYGYADASAVAATLLPSSEPPQTVNPGGLTTQTLAVSQAVGNSVGMDVAVALPRLVSALPAVLEALASPVSEDPLLGLDLLLASVSAVTASASITASLTSIAGSLAVPTQVVGGGSASLGAVLANGAAGGALSSAQFAGAAVSADVGRAAALGALSVPQSWTANAAPAIGSAALSGGGLGSAAPAAALEAGAVPSLLGVQPLGRPARGGRSGGLRMGRGRSVIPRTVCAG
jgi:PPE-repeat protein